MAQLKRIVREGLLGWVVAMVATIAAKAQGTLEGEVDGVRVELPELSVAIAAQVQGDLASVTITQTFSNPYGKPMHARYLFPLQERAAVYGMTMLIGDERIKAVVKEREEAQRAFETAKADGKAASLLTEHRPNVLSQDIANLMPGLPISVEVKYVHAVPKVDGAYQLVVPLVVGPRYENASTAALEKLPVYPRVEGLTLAKGSLEDRVSFAATLASGMPVTDVSSPTHPIVISAAADGSTRVSLGEGKAKDERDLIVRFRLAGPKINAGMTSAYDQRGGFFSLLIEPPPFGAPVEAMPREMVFLLDCSGSMDGLPLDASKKFMRQALSGLRSTDVFRIIRFSDRATEFSSAPLTSSSENVERALAYIDSLTSEGGTEMSSGIVQALSPPPTPGTMRIVTFLTDGYIGNEQQVLGLVERLRGDARLFAFGVGSGVNRFLMEKLGEIGRGFTRYMDPTEDPDEVARSLALRLAAPVLTDVSIDWGSMDPEEVTPSPLPDVFQGFSLRIQGRYSKPGKHTVKVKGMMNGLPVELPVRVELSGVQESAKSDAIPLMWARSKIDHLMDALSASVDARQGQIADASIKDEVTRLGTSFNLTTRWTSFVATTERVVNHEPSNAKSAQVPLPMVKGVTNAAYAPSDSSFFGSSTPEPSAYLGLAAVAFAYAVVRRKKFQEVAA